MSELDSQKDLAESKQNLRRSLCVLLLALIAWPVGLLLHPWASLIIFAVLAIYGSISTYISYMHYLAAKNRVKFRDPE